MARAIELGADVTINYATEDVLTRVHEATGGHGADIALEHVGGEVFGASLNALAIDGRVVVCGGHAGEVVPVDLIELFRHEWSISRRGAAGAGRVPARLPDDSHLQLWPRRLLSPVPVVLQLPCLQLRARLLLRRWLTQGVPGDEVPLGLMPSALRARIANGRTGLVFPASH